MLMRKSAVLINTLATINAVPSAVYGSSTSSSSRQRKSTRPRQCIANERRAYATIAGDNGSQREHVDHEPHAWPKAPKGQPHPTPYQILAMKSTATYSKTRYYELVKLYHPDRGSSAPSSSSNDLPPAVKLERYRLIVAAHTILSDPTKRSAYDRFGAGWNGRAEVRGAGSSGHTSSAENPAGPFSRSWNDPNDPIWQNATWEDWQRYWEWRASREAGGSAARPRPAQAPVYFRNSYFVVLVAILAMIGSTANSKRAHDAGTYFIEQRDLMHDRTAKELRRVKREAEGSSSRQDRIDWFLRNRDATLGFGSAGEAEALREEKAERQLGEREVCNSEEIGNEGG